MSRERYSSDEGSNVEVMDAESDASNVHIAENTQNRVEYLNGRDSENGGKNTRKRKKGSKGSVDTDSFSNLNTDDKLIHIFDILNKNYEKIITVEAKQNECISDVQKVNNDNVEIKGRIDQIEELYSVQERKIQMLSYRSIDIEARSRRNNIIFWGLTENSKFLTKQLIYRFLEDELNIDTYEMVIERAHRLGSINSPANRSKDDPRRPIIVRFRDYADTDTVMENAYKLKGMSFGVDRDYPKEIADARKHLYKSKEATEARANREKFQIRYPAKLYVKGKLIKDEFPDWFDVMNHNRLEEWPSKPLKRSAELLRSRIYSKETVIENDTSDDDVFNSVQKVNKDFAPTARHIQVSRDQGDPKIEHVQMRGRNSALLNNSLPVKAANKSESRSRNSVKSQNINSKNSSSFVSGSDKIHMRPASRSATSINRSRVNRSNSQHVTSNTGIDHTERRTADTQ